MSHSRTDEAYDPVYSIFLHISDTILALINQYGEETVDRHLSRYIDSSEDWPYDVFVSAILSKRNNNYQSWVTSKESKKLESILEKNHAGIKDKLDAIRLFSSSHRNKSKNLFHAIQNAENEMIKLIDTFPEIMKNINMENQNSFLKNTTPNDGFKTK